MVMPIVMAPSSSACLTTWKICPQGGRISTTTCHFTSLCYPMPSNDQRAQLLITWLEGVKSIYDMGKMHLLIVNDQEGQKY